VTKRAPVAGSVGADDRIRLFCALELAPETVACIVDWQHAHLPDRVRAVPPANLHVTLAFLGHRPAREVPAIVGELTAAAAHACVPSLVVRRYRETPGVGMLVLEETGVTHAAAFAADLHERLERLGVYRREGRPWLPHVTVFRSKGRAGLRLDPPNTCSIRVVRSALYRSTPGPGGVRYDALDTAALGGSGGSGPRSSS
jgi:RNA 2',3'-cyclic 3'-phosphodiesterase